VGRDTNLPSLEGARSVTRTQCDESHPCHRARLPSPRRAEGAIVSLRWGPLVRNVERSLDLPQGASPSVAEIARDDQSDRPSVHRSPLCDTRRSARSMGIAGLNWKRTWHSPSRHERRTRISVPDRVARNSVRSGLETSLDHTPPRPPPGWTNSKPILRRFLITDLDFAVEHLVRNLATRARGGASRRPRPGPVEASQSETSFGEYVHGGWGSGWSIDRFGIERATGRWGPDAKNL